ncbi:uncharacterized protein ARMOST_12549 [Armillaria ostoyae]|uniref:C2H2-type domain-containing protein n=1 Tax=Armillaria ostoyae TaxID=47428 RepID=A0A284RK85_ARMOS|nr:uncharacterized protein ARMOST_12549 [Armillaria ostoyae]
MSESWTNVFGRDSTHGDLLRASSAAWYSPLIPFPFRLQTAFIDLVAGAVIIASVHPMSESWTNVFGRPIPLALSLFVTVPRILILRMVTHLPASSAALYSPLIPFPFRLTAFIDLVAGAVIIGQRPSRERSISLMYNQAPLHASKLRDHQCTLCQAHLIMEASHKLKQSPQEMLYTDSYPSRSSDYYRLPVATNPHYAIPGQGAPMAMHPSQSANPVSRINDSSSHSSRAEGGDSTSRSREGYAVNKTRYECSYCGKGFSRPNALKIHVISRIGDKG